MGVESEREWWHAAKLAMPDLHHEFIDVLSGPGVVAGRAVVAGTMPSGTTRSLSFGR